MKLLPLQRSCSNTLHLRITVWRPDARGLKIELGSVETWIFNKSQSSNDRGMQHSMGLPALAHRALRISGASPQLQVRHDENNGDDDGDGSQSSTGTSTSTSTYLQQ
jgi:hypothetical protein